MTESAKPQSPIFALSDADSPKGRTTQYNTLLPDTAVNRLLHGGPRTPRVDEPSLRKLLVIELILVLAIFPLGSALSALTSLIQRIQTGSPSTSDLFPQLSGPWLAVGIEVLQLLPFLAAALLVLYLLTRSGEGVTAINLRGGRIRMDFALLLPTFYLAFWIPQWLGFHILSWTHTQGFYLNYFLPSKLALTIGLVALSIASGIVEEIIVLGYLVRRLEQLGVPIAWIVVADVVVRVSYHLYYGFNLLPIAMWATASVLLYLRMRRLLPFILCHIMYDTLLTLRFYYPEIHTPLWIVLLVFGVLMTVVWLRASPNRVEETRAMASS